MPKTVSHDLISDLLLEFLPSFFQKLSAVALVKFGPCPLELCGLFAPFNKHKTLHLTSPFLPECFLTRFAFPFRLSSTCRTVLHNAYILVWTLGDFIKS